MRPFRRFSPFALFAWILAAGLLASCDSGGTTSPSPQPAEQSTAEQPQPPLGGASVVGSVVIPDGVDAFGVLVFAEGDSYSAYTDAAGYFRLRGLPPGDYLLRAVRADLQPAVVGEVVVSEEDAGEIEPIAQLEPTQMSLRPSQGGLTVQDLRSLLGAVEGTVAPIDPLDQQGVVVELLGSGYRTVTGPEGEFAFPNVFPGSYRVLYQAPGYRDVDRSITVAAGQTLSLSPQVLEFSVGGDSGTDSAGGRRGRSLFGQVVMSDAAGNAVSDYADVQVVIPGTSSFAIPDETGAFAIYGLPARPLTVSAQAPNYTLVSPARVDLTEIEAAEVTLELRGAAIPGEDEAFIVGQALLSDDGDGQGNAGITVSLAGTNYVATTDVAGSYAIFNIAPGTYDLVATMSGYERATLEGVFVAGGQRLEPDILVLDKEVEAPVVLSTDPSDGADDVTIEDPTRVTILFSQSMDAASVAEAISISPDVDYQVAMARGSDTRAVVTLAGYAPIGEGEILRFGRRYTLRVGKEATNLEGVAMEEPFDMSFTTGEAKIIATRPADNEEGAVVISSQPIVVSFNAPVEIERLRSSEIRVRPSLNTQPTFYLRTDRRTGWSQLMISANFLPDEDYTITLRGNGIQTITGDRITNMPYTFEFSTAAWSEIYPGQDGRSSRDRLDEERRRR